MLQRDEIFARLKRVENLLLGRELFDDIGSKPLEEGIRSLILMHARHLREVKVVDPGILVDIDTPDDYWRYIENK